MGYCVLRTKAWPDWYHLFGEKQTPFPFICVSVCKGEISCKYSIQEAASKTPAYRTRTEPEDVKLKSYMRWLFLIHPLGPFSHCDFHSKDSYPSPYVPCIMCETWEWKSETTQNQMVNFKMATMAGEISRTFFVWRPFTCAPCHRAPFLSSSSVGTRQQPFQFSTSTNYNSKTAPKQLCKNAERKADKNERWNKFIEARTGPDGSWDEEVLPVASIVFYAPVISLTSFCCCFYSSVLNLLFWKYKLARAGRGTLQNNLREVFKIQSFIYSVSCSESKFSQNLVGDFLTVKLNLFGKFFLKVKVKVFRK